MCAPLQADAIRDSLKSLFAEPELPDNPYYYLAAALGAYVDQNPLWSESDVGIISALDNDGGLDVADATSKLCKLAASSCVLGLPHVLRTVSKDGELTVVFNKSTPAVLPEDGNKHCFDLIHPFMPCRCTDCA